MGTRTKKGNEARYWPKVQVGGPEDCWLWLASTNPKGYGIFNVDDPSSPIGMSSTGAHRYAWQRLHGPIPDGMFVDHICFTRDCQNPAHLRLLSASESSLRENKVPVTKCKRGHEFTPENTALHSVSGAYICRTCKREYQREWDRRQPRRCA